MDREKVIKALEHCKDNQHVNDCDKCDYGGKTGTFCIRMINDALVLLKEQEDVKPVPPIDESDLWRCGYCHRQIMRCTHQRFCEECGRKIGWEDM